MIQILGIDYGAKRIGLALGDEKAGMAFPFDVIENKSKKYVSEKLKEICSKENIKKIIIGMPISLKGEKKNKQIKDTEKFIEDLKNVCPDKEILTEDERLTTKMVESLQKQMDGAQMVDKDAVAAMIILQSYLDRVKS